MRTPMSQLISGQGNVTDGLILRITTEGLFIDDDVRGVAQREWDIKAWTLKLTEVWCPYLHPLSPNVSVCRSQRRLSSRAFIADARPSVASSQDESKQFVERLVDQCLLSCREAALYRNIAAPSYACNISRSSSCYSSTSSQAFVSARSDTSTDTITQSVEVTGLHILRASIRDQEGKKYVFILSQAEGWKVAVGLQRLRKGTQVRAMGVAGLPMNEARMLVETLGWG